MKKILFCILLFHFHCATIFSGSEETFRVKSQISGTEIYFNNQLMGIDSVEFTVSKKETVTLKVSKYGCRGFRYKVKRKINEDSKLGFFLDAGIVSIIIVDWIITGAIHSSENTNFILDPDCTKSAFSLRTVL